MAFILQKESTKASQGSQQRGSAASDRTAASASKGGPQCGQCEQKTAVVSCFECSERYCPHCFASFHLRGALKKHRSVPLIGGTTVAAEAVTADTTARSPADLGAAVPADRAEGSSSAKLWAVPAGQHPAAGDDKRSNGGSNSRKMQESVIASQNLRKSEGRSAAVTALPPPAALMVVMSSPEAAETSSNLLDGTFSEADSAQSFQEALKQWRTSGTASSDVAAGTKRNKEQSSAAATRKLGVRFNAMETYRTASPSCVDEGTSTAMLKPVAYEPEFQSSGEITYADRLLLKRHRRTELSSLPDCRSSSSNGGGGGSDRRTVPNSSWPPAQSPSGEDYCGNGDEDVDDATEPDLPIDFLQLRDLVTPSLHNASTGSERLAVVTFDIVEADDLSNDTSIEQQKSRYKVIEDGEVLEDTAIPTKPKTKEGNSSHRSHSLMAKEDVAAPHTSSAYRGKTPNLEIMQSSTIPAVQSGPIKLELPAKAVAKRLASAAADASVAGSLTSNGPTGKPDLFSKPIHHASSNVKVGALAAADGSVSLMPTSARSDRGTQSRSSNKARPSSRARSRAERAAELRNGGLSLTATESLKSVSRRSQDVLSHPADADRGLHVDALGDFFCLWSAQEPIERTLTPTSRKQNKDADSGRSNLDIQRHHISNKIYQTSPQVWRPQSSMADAVTEDEAARCVSAMPAVDMLYLRAAVVDGFSPGSGEVDIQQADSRDREHSAATASSYSSTDAAPDRASPMMAASPPVNGSSRQGPYGFVESRRTAEETPPSAKHDAASALTSLKESRLQPQQSETPREQLRQQREKSNSFSMQGSHVQVGKSASSQRHDSHSAGLSLRKATSKDSLASCDMLGDRTPRSSDGNDELRTLDELERELASQTGRLTADGITSCLPDSLDAEDQEAAPSETSDNGDRKSTLQDQPDDLINQHNRTWDLRESMMHDFDDMEQAFADESEDYA